jgi:hypothetical protein
VEARGWALRSIANQRDGETDRDGICAHGETGDAPAHRLLADLRQPSLIDASHAPLEIASNLAENRIEARPGLGEDKRHLHHQLARLGLVAHQLVGQELGEDDPESPGEKLRRRRRHWPRHCKIDVQSWRRGEGVAPNGQAWLPARGMSHPPDGRLAAEGRWDIVCQQHLDGGYLRDSAVF